MKYFFDTLAVGVITMLLSGQLLSATKMSVASGSWSSAATWSPSGTPGPNDIVIIAGGTTVTITTNETVSDLTIQSGGIVQGDGLAHTVSIGKGGGEDFLNNGLFDAKGTTARLQKSTQWGGTGICNFSNLDLNSKTLVFTAGATLTMNFSAAGDPFSNYGTVTGIASVTFNYNGTSAQVLTANASLVYGNLLINNAAGVAAQQALTSANVLGDFRVQSGVFSNGAFAVAGNATKTFEVGNGASFQLTGTTAMVTGFGTKTFGASSTVEYAGASQTVSLENYGNLKLAGSGTKTLPASPMTMLGGFQIGGTAVTTASPALTVEGDLSVLSGATFNAASASHIIKRNFNNSGSLQMSGATFTFSGASAQTIGGTSITLFSSVTINNPAGVSLNSNQAFYGTLNFVAGCLSLGSNSLTLGSSASGAGAGKCIVTDGTGAVLSHAILGGQSFQFPVAPTSSSYNPITIALAPADPTEYFSVRVSPTVDPTSPDNSLAVQRTWHVAETTTGGNSATLTFAWVNAENGGNFAPIAGSGVYRYNSGVSTYQLVSIITSLGSSPYTASTIIPVSSFGAFVIGTAGGLPVQLASFTGSFVGNNLVRLSWRTVSEVNNYGFFVQQRLGERFVDVANSFVAGHGTTNEPQNYAFTHSLVTSASIEYRIKQVDLDGTEHFSDPILVRVPTSVNEETAMQFSLHQNYPNPFNPTTNFGFRISNFGLVTLKVFDVLGREVATLVNEPLNAGTYKFEWNATNVSSGMYYYRLNVGSFSDVKKMIVMK